jgi:hypothetical protein
LKQIEDIKQQRAQEAKEMAEKAAAQAGPHIMMSLPGREPVPVGINDLVNIINQQQQQMKEMAARIQELEKSQSPSDETTKRIVLPKDIVEPAVYQEKIATLEKTVKSLEIKNRDLRTDIKFLNIRNAELTAELDAKKNAHFTKTIPIAMPQPASKSDPEVFVSLT